MPDNGRAHFIFYATHNGHRMTCFVRETFARHVAETMPHMIVVPL